MRRRIAFLALAAAAVACSDGVTGPCELLVRPVLAGRLIQLDDRGCVVHVDSLYSRVEVLADTFRVCGTDTAKISLASRKFVGELPSC
jgi:hypothetical protein